MIKILFVCHGNICRSPMAEFMFKDEVRRLGKEDLYDADSAATSSEEIWNGIGNPVYPPAKKMLARHGISCEGKRARLLKKEDYEHYDLIIGMDEMNRRNMMRILGSDPDGKVSLLLDLTDNPRSVADPWYTGDFQKTYDDISEGIAALLAKLESML
ncbi:MAG: low molecular weight phosphotyrosine protein phosphatase [Clostridiales bacterium]|nr:low molecular weight phosphotyrosine protein phosphatase [Clostridiales bacterium]MCR5199635.1 low molecular weight phosphotyrosine protein phosphatase [Saccharofermentans sp.]